MPNSFEFKTVNQEKKKDNTLLGYLIERLEKNKEEQVKVFVTSQSGEQFLAVFARNNEKGIYCVDAKKIEDIQGDRLAILSEETAIQDKEYVDAIESLGVENINKDNFIEVSDYESKKYREIVRVITKEREMRLRLWEYIKIEGRDEPFVKDVEDRMLPEFMLTAIEGKDYNYMEFFIRKISDLGVSQEILQNASTHCREAIRKAAKLLIRAQEKPLTENEVKNIAISIAFDFYIFLSNMKRLKGKLNNSDFRAAENVYILRPTRISEVHAKYPDLKLSTIKSFFIGRPHLFDSFIESYAKNEKALLQVKDEINQREGKEVITMDTLVAACTACSDVESDDPVELIKNTFYSVNEILGEEEKKAKEAIKEGENLKSLQYFKVLFDYDGKRPTSENFKDADVSKKNMIITMLASFKAGGKDSVLERAWYIFEKNTEGKAEEELKKDLEVYLGPEIKEEE